MLENIGGLLDTDTRLVYRPARCYEEAKGTWTSADPQGFNGGQANYYVYVGNDPTDKTDPRGLDAIKVIAVWTKERDLVGERTQLGDPKGYKTVLYSSIPDLIKQLGEMAARGDQVEVLEISGHGNPKKCGDFLEEDASLQGRRLKAANVLAKGATIYLAACNTGLGTGKLAQDLADSTGCVVYGTRGYNSGTHADDNEDCKRTIFIDKVFYDAYEGSINAKGNDIWKAFYPKSPPGDYAPRRLPANQACA